MRLSILKILILEILLISLVYSTRLTFYIDQEIEQPLDYVEINAVIKADGDSLEESIKTASDTISSI